MIDLKSYARPQESEGECLLCGAPLTYLVRGEMMECAFCHKKETSKTRCMKGHYVCNECHARGVDSLLPLCLSHTSSNPVALLETLMDAPFCHMHGPEHHVLVGASLLTAYANAGGTLDLKNALLEMLRRGGQIPGGACGFWGACGAAVSAGIFVSIALGATPLATDSWGFANQTTARALAAIGAIGGPRCCKRDSYLAIRETVPFIAEKTGVRMELGKIACRRSAQNSQCIGKRCPFSSAGRP